MLGFATLKNYTTLKHIEVKVSDPLRFATLKNYTTLKHNLYADASFSVICYPKKLHYSQTTPATFARYSLICYPKKLHYSQTSIEKAPLHAVLF